MPGEHTCGLKQSFARHLAASADVSGCDIQPCYLCPTYRIVDNLTIDCSKAIEITGGGKKRLKGARKHATMQRRIIHVSSRRQLNRSLFNEPAPIPKKASVISDTLPTNIDQIPARGRVAICRSLAPSEGQQCRRSGPLQGVMAN
jgi:hypothetical protein